MKEKSAGFEMKDPFLVDYKQNLEELVKNASVGSGPTQLLMIEMIRSRWIKDRRATYPFEVAWVFDRNEENVAKILASLEEAGDLEHAGLLRGKKGLAKPYKPKTLKKTAKPSTSRAKAETIKRPRIRQKRDWGRI
ncbi:MAG TPA: hypothetical protein VFV92_11400 [Candidatus Bathyarchaeia archaeon]|nr:hypothetical protein [Candidatus Bathyarchaeia archaeon]